ncbi:MAG TPA: SRPBCC family protein [Methylomirabilota bacterium]|jgi:ribosome-associated toxin RatA of RatAB toxin-antitoxin module|nr:SRPBCC family protein [Methylomirabilota bacterium]
MLTPRRPRRLAPAARLVLVLALLTAGLVTAAWPAPPPLSADQKRRLSAGEVLVRDEMPPGASESARGGTALGLVHGTPEQVWRVLVDYPGHARYYPRVTSAELVESNERRAVVRYTVGIGPFTSTFHMDKFPDARRRRIEWHLSQDRATGMFRENSGYWQVDELDRASLVTYAIAVRTVLPGFMTGSSERDSLVETIVGLRRVVEQEGTGPKPR